MEEGGDDVKSARPLRPGLHTCYNGRYSESVAGDCHPILKAVPSSDRGLQPDPVKLDSLVIAHQPWRGEYVPGPCTHRPSSHESRDKVAVPEGAAGTPPFWSQFTFVGSIFFRCLFGVVFTVSFLLPPYAAPVLFLQSIGYAI